MKKTNGISLITLIITIIVIIILAAIVIFTGLNTPDRANFARFTQEVGSLETAVLNEWQQQKIKTTMDGLNSSDAQIYYAIATGSNLTDINDIIPVSDLAVSALPAIKPDSFRGTYCYEITVPKISGLSAQTKYYEETEKHYITDKGEVFVLPGYCAEGENNKWYINSSHYYESNEPVTGPKSISATLLGLYTDQNGENTATVGSVEVGVEDVYIRFTASIDGGTTSIASVTPATGIEAITPITDSNGVTTYIYKVTTNSTWTFTIHADGVADYPLLVEVRSYNIPTIATSNIEIGDYVYYEGDGAYTLLTSKTGYSSDYTDGKLELLPETITSWRVWDIKENGDIVIMPWKAVNRIVLRNETGFIHSLEVIEGVCDMYTNESLGVTSGDITSLTLEELERQEISNMATIKYLYHEGDPERRYNATYQEIYGGSGYISGTFLMDDAGENIVSARTATSNNPINIRQTFCRLTGTGYYTSGEAIVWTPINPTPKTGITNHYSLLKVENCMLASPRVALTSDSFATFFIPVLNSLGDIIGDSVCCYSRGGGYPGTSVGVRPLVTLSSSLQVVGANTNSGKYATPWVFQK